MNRARPAAILALIGISACVAGCGSNQVGTKTTPLRGAAFDVTHYGARGDGSSDNTAAFAEAIAAAQAAGGGTVYVPPGTFAFSARKTSSPASVVIDGTVPVTLQGAGRDETSLIQASSGKGLLGVHVDGTTVEDLTLDTQTHDAGADIFVQANHTSLAHMRVLGGSRHFALYYAGPKGARLLAPLYNEGNSVTDLQLNELVCDDGFSWSFQKDSTITDVTHTGSRLALYGDANTTVTNYTYAPGSQQCGARNGFWLTPPADHITIVDFTSSGEGGKVGIIGPGGVGKVASDVTIRGLTMTGSGYHLAIGDVLNLVLEDCHLGANTIVVNARAQAQGTISNSTYGQLVHSSAPGARDAISAAGVH